MLLATEPSLMPAPGQFRQPGAVLRIGLVPFQGPGVRLATSRSGSTTDGNRRAARQGPGQYRRLTHARSSNGGYPARGSGTNLIDGLERAIGGR